MATIPISLRADWVFAYGSLIWNPEIDYDHSELTRIHGFHRAFCIRSMHHRGTPEAPGVVLGLDRGGSCVGMAYRLRPETGEQSLQTLYDREMTDRVYVPTLLGVSLASGERVLALTFVADRRSPAYQRLSEMEILRRVGTSVGERGANLDYLFNTVRSLESHGVHDVMLTRLAQGLARRTPPDGLSDDPRPTRRPSTQPGPARIRRTGMKV